MIANIVEETRVIMEALANIDGPQSFAGLQSITQVLQKTLNTRLKGNHRNTAFSDHVAISSDMLGNSCDILSAVPDV